VIPSILLFLAMLPAAMAQEPVTVEVGDQAHVFTLPRWNLAENADPASIERVSLSDYVGLRPSRPSQAIVLAFFQRSDGDGFIRALNNVAEQYEALNIRVLGIEIDTTQVSAAESWLKAIHPAYPILRDSHRIVADRYGVRTSPWIVVVDGQGLVYAVGSPPVNELDNAVSAEINALLHLK
jgi:peroxiredoxin